MISFDNSFFFDQNGYDFLNNESFKKNLNKVFKKSEKLYKEFEDEKNEVLQSFTKSYQKKIRDLKTNIDIKNKKRVVIGLGGSSSGAKALSFYLKDETIYFDNLDYEYLNNFFKNVDIKNYFFFIISKSGDTFETLALLNLLILESKKVKKNQITIFLVLCLL